MPADIAREVEEPSPALDLTLLQASQADPDPLPLLCLRCRVSHPIEAWLRATHRRFERRHGLDLLAMASYGLDDTGELTISRDAKEKVPFTYAEIASRPPGLISPFGAEVIRTYDPDRCGLPHWARLKIQAHNGLKSYFREYGLLLISPWALLRDSSPRRVREACQQHLRGATSVERLLELHARYRSLYDEAKAAYKARTGKASGWQPDLPFLRRLDPEVDPFATHEHLLALDHALRVLLSGAWQRGQSGSGADGDEGGGPDGDPVARLADPSTLDPSDQDDYSAAELLELIQQALQRSLDRIMPAELAAERQRFSRSPERQLAWELYGKGLSQRDIAPRCDKQQAWVSKLLDEKRRSFSIATAAAMELRRHPAFASCGRSEEAAERLVEALRNHLINPEREGDIAPLRRWVQNALTQP